MNAPPNAYRAMKLCRLVVLSIATAIALVGGGGGAAVASAQWDRFDVRLAVVGTGKVEAVKQSSQSVCTHSGRLFGICTLVYLREDLVEHECPSWSVNTGCLYALIGSTPGQRVTWDEFCYFPEGASTCWLMLVGWAGDPQLAKAGTMSVGSIRIVLGGAQTRTLARSTLKVGIQGSGQVRSSRGLPLCRTRTESRAVCSARVTVGGSLVLVAVPDPGWQFSKWLGCPDPRRTTCRLIPKASSASLIAVFAKQVR